MICEIKGCGNEAFQYRHARMVCWGYYAKQVCTPCSNAMRYVAMYKYGPAAINQELFWLQRGLKLEKREDV